MSRVIDRCIAIGVTTLLSTCLLPDAVWQEQSVTGESRGAAGASSSMPASGSNAEPPADVVAGAEAAPQREGTGGGTQVPLAPPRSSAAGDMMVGVTDAGASCSTGAACTSGACGDGACLVATCSDGVQNQDETGADCGGNCAPCGPGQSCLASSDCASGVCQDGRCCGGLEGDCTRCARNLVSDISCDTQGPAARPACDAFLQCLADNPSACVHRYDGPCSAPGGACDVAQYGGNGSAGIVLADAILGTASCTF